MKENIIRFYWSSWTSSRDFSVRMTYSLVEKPNFKTSCKRKESNGYRVNTSICEKAPIQRFSSLQFQRTSQPNDLNTTSFLRLRDSISTGMKIWFYQTSWYRSDEGLTLETSAFQVFHGGNSTFIDSFDKSKLSCFTPPPTQHHSFFEN